MTSPITKILAAAVMTVVVLNICIAALPSTRASTSITIQPALADTYVDGQNQNRNFGTSPDLRVEALSTRSERALLTFSLSSVPLGQVIISATLSLFMTGSPTTTRTLGEHQILSNWTELGTTWSNQPSFTTIPTATSQTGIIGNVFLTWNVTSDVSAGYANPSAWFGFLIKDENETNSSQNSLATFNSTNSQTSANRPMLTVIYALQIPEVPFTVGLLLTIGGVIFLGKIRYPMVRNSASNTPENAGERFD